MAEAEFSLPSEFLSDDLFFHTDEKSTKETNPNSPAESSSSVADTESDEEDHLADLTRHMTHSFLFDADTNAGDKQSRRHVKAAAGTSPQSTLCDYGIWSGSSVASQSSSPPTTPSDHRKDDNAWDLLTAAAGQVVRLSSRDGLLGSPAATKRSPPVVAPRRSDTVSSSSSNGFYSKPHQQQFYRVPQKTWGRGGGGGEGRYGGRAPLGLPSSAWPPLQKQQNNQQREQQQQQPQHPQPGSGMRAIFLTGSGATRGSTGTGVFLPRRPGTVTDHHRKKPACSTVLLPDRVIQALNLNLDDMGSHPRCPGGYILDHDALVARGKQTQYRLPVSSSSAANDIHLPAEWTY